ncbi:hypothetical protein I302_106483 [Kwoniella bestiolae CBS 10118]|uniref:ferric-chelate reductase (NADPH) n=1 Tax=Kwoniella bestiolae CBS 10118 TaxID=1296100 RepID=A0A1B9G1B6_9TREE|nr:ferric reductase transmembrane component 4 [Kwoniella bestiolae CBS 10118]OCF24798.1 ferric reductase transmembrane component 4 [Kwoniella bestiolae CBS 10118]
MIAPPDPQRTFIMPTPSPDIPVTLTITPSPSASPSAPSDISSALSIDPSSSFSHGNGPTTTTLPVHGHGHKHQEGPLMYKAYVMPYSWYWILGVFGLMVICHAYRQIKHRYRKRRYIQRMNESSISSYKPISTNEGDEDGDEHQPLQPSTSSRTIITDKVKPNIFRRVTTGLSASFRNRMYLSSFPWWLYGPETYMDALFTVVYCTVYMYLCLHLTDSWFPLRNDNIANRFGIMSFSQLPIILLLVSKNNPISSLTGITYQKLNYLHRASSRICLLTSWGHAILWTPRVWAARDFRQYLLCGIAALFGFTMLWVTSFRFIRRAAYEFFLASHIIFTIMYLVGAWFHWRWLGQWVIPAMVIWIFDRLLRFAQVIYQNNFHNPRKWSTSGDCKIELLDHDVMRITIRRDNFHWRAGQHAFISAPSISGMPHESHPFSIANVPTEVTNEAYFLVRVHSGFTKRLRTALSSDLSTDIPLYIEGPYGYPHSLDSYSTVLLLAGGTGVTFVLGHFLQILQNLRKGKSAVKKLHLVWHIRHSEDIEWIAPLLNQGIHDSLDIQSDLEITIDIYVTKTHSSDEPWPPELDIHLNEVNQTLHQIGPRILQLREQAQTQEQWDDGCRTCTPATPIVESRDEPILLPKRQVVLGRFGLTAETAEKVHWRKGRANLGKIVKQDAEASEGPMNVSVCGPVQLLQASKAAIKEASNLRSCMEGLGSIDFFEETLGA